MLVSIGGFARTSLAQLSSLPCKDELRGEAALATQCCLGEQRWGMSLAPQPTIKRPAPEYIAGLVEGDGSIKVPTTLRSDKGKLIYPSVTIVFVDKDLPLAEILVKTLEGTLNKSAGN
jgi:hypothetical protein